MNMIDPINNTWQRAKNVIPGGSHLFSKRQDLHLPGLWPTHYLEAKGIRLKATNGRWYTDFNLMGVGTCTLGYANGAVNSAVRKSLRSSNLTTLNSIEEIQTAERLVEIHPWASMVRFARTGGEANAVAVRIARAASGRDGVAFSGYHGWHDWYLSANLAEEGSLAQHLLPGLECRGVPRGLRNTAHPFGYGDLEGLKRILSQNRDVGVIKIEVSRSASPPKGFLEGVKALSIQYRCVLIFDECTSGFRETFGGIHKRYGITPDLAVFGKAIGNGFALTAVVGTREVMEYCQSSFISSTFWTERIGYVAALATLNEMERLGSWRLVQDYGERFKKSICELFGEYNIDIEFSGLSSIPVLRINHEDGLYIKAYITQELLKKGYLFTNIFYVSILHNEKSIESLLRKLRSPLVVIERMIKEGKSLKNLLECELPITGFKRLA